MALSRAWLICLLLVASLAGADERSARVNYMLHCQGCHLPNADGVEGRVPPIRNVSGRFLQARAGREFLIRVPGVSQSALDDVQVAELMNWLLLTFSAEQLPQPFVPFTADEVHELRQRPEPDPERRRREILADIDARMAPPPAAGETR